MMLWGWRGTPQQMEFLDHVEAKALLAEARATTDLFPQARASFLENELKLLDVSRPNSPASPSSNPNTWSKRMNASAP